MTGKKTRKLSLRLDPDEMEIVIRRAGESGQNVSDFARMRILESDAPADNELKPHRERGRKGG